MAPAGEVGGTRWHAFRPGPHSMNERQIKHSRLGELVFVRFRSGRAYACTGRCTLCSVHDSRAGGALWEGAGTSAAGDPPRGSRVARGPTRAPSASRWWWTPDWIWTWSRSHVPLGPDPTASAGRAPGTADGMPRAVSPRPQPSRWPRPRSPEPPGYLMARPSPWWASGRPWLHLSGTRGPGDDAGAPSKPLDVPRALFSYRSPRGDPSCPVIEAG